MTKPMIRIHNTETDEIIDREMNAQEIAQHEIDAQTVINARAKIAANEAAKVSALAKLAALGLTPEEISAIS